MVIGRAYLHLYRPMSIEDLLYHLQHPESLDPLSLTEINQLMIKYPYLEALKLIYEKKLNPQDNPGWAALDLNHRLELAALQAYQSGGELTYSPPVFDLPQNGNIIEDTVASPEIVPEPLLMTEVPVEEVKFQLYPYEESDFIRYLGTLPPVLIHSENGVPEIPEIPYTEKLIRDSVDLQPNFGTEALADLWASQGKTQQAMVIYEKLSFEYPDKKDIFAAKIEKLKAENSI